MKKLEKPGKSVKLKKLRKLEKSLCAALAVVLALAAVAMAGCSGSGEQPAPGTSAPASASASAEPSAAAEAGAGASAESSAVAETSAETSEETSAAPEQAEEKEPVTLSWWYRGNGEQADTFKVQDRMNELLESYAGLEHVSAILECIAAADYSTQVMLGLAAGQKMDILNTVSISFPEQVINGTYIPLDPYLPALSELTAELPDWFIERGEIDGKTYMIPNYQQMANKLYFIAPKEYMDKYGDYGKLRSTILGAGSTIREKAAAVEEYVRAVQEGEGPTKYAEGVGWNLDTYSSQFYDYVPGSDNTFVVPFDSGKVVFRPFDEEAVAAYEISARWYADGILCPDPAIDRYDLIDGNMLNPMSCAFTINQPLGSSDADVSRTMSDAYGFEAAAFGWKSSYFIGYSYSAGNGVTASCANPLEAAKFIEAMNVARGAEIYNTVVYGLEGVHYEKLDDRHIRTFGYDGPQGGSDYLYSAHKWIMGNSFNAYLNQAVRDEDLEVMKSINEGPDTVKSNLAGLVFDTEAVSTEFSQIVAVYGEYKDGLLGGLKGSDGWQAYYDEFRAKVEAAGAQKVLDHLQGQLDGFLRK
jgi:putative aldouronate transport system substrate-binding protein